MLEQRLNYFSIFVNSDEFGVTNNDLQTALAKENIMTRIYFFPPVHTQDAYKEYYEKYKDELPNTELVCRKIICLPLFSHMSNEIVVNVCNAIERIYENRELVRNIFLDSKSCCS